MIVDDEIAVRELLQTILNAAGYSTTLAANGEDALKAASRESFGLGLLDIRMPGLSGIEVLKRFNLSYPKTAVIMMTAVDDAEAAAESMKLGACDYITKPWNLEDLITRIKKAEERRDFRLLVEDYQGSLETRVEEQATQIRENTVRTIQSIIKENDDRQPPEASV